MPILSILWQHGFAAHGLRAVELQAVGKLGRLQIMLFHPTRPITRQEEGAREPMSEKRGPCPAAEYGSRGEWTCAVHDTADPGSCYEPRDESACRNYDPKNGRSGDVCLVCGFGPAVHVASLEARIKELEGELHQRAWDKDMAEAKIEQLRERASRAEAERDELKQEMEFRDKFVYNALRDEIPFIAVGQHPGQFRIETAGQLLKSYRERLERTEAQLAQVRPVIEKVARFECACASGHGIICLRCEARAILSSLPAHEEAK